LFRRRCRREAVSDVLELVVVPEELEPEGVAPGVTPCPKAGGFVLEECLPAVSERALESGIEYCLPAGEPGST
jgi:hypothetical protein